MTMLRRHWPMDFCFRPPARDPVPVLRLGKGRHSASWLTLLSEIGVMAIFALSYNMLMGQAGPAVGGTPCCSEMGAYCAAHVVNLVKQAHSGCPTELGPLTGGSADCSSASCSAGW